MAARAHLAHHRPGRSARVHRRVAACVGVAVGAIALSCLAAPAAWAAPIPGWSRPERLTQTDYYFEAVDGAIASDGTAVVVVNKGQKPDVYAKVRSGGAGEWSKRELITLTLDSAPLVGAQDGGVVAVVWLDRSSAQLATHLVIRRYDANGWGAARQLVVPRSTRLVDMDMDARGDVAVITAQESGLVAAISPVQGQWTVEPPLTDAGSLRPTRVLFSNDRQLSIVATEYRDGEDHAIVVARLNPGGVWATTRLAPPDDSRVSDVAAEVGPEGTIALLWTESDFDEGWSRDVLQVAAPDGTFGARRVLAGSDKRDCWYPTRCADVAFGAADRLMVAWSTGGAGSGVLAADRSADGTWSDPVSVPLATPASGVLDVGVNPDGSAVIEAFTEFASCPTLTTCASVGAPARWPPALRYSWLAAGPGGSAYALYGERLCSGRCYGRPYWSIWASD